MNNWAEISSVDAMFGVASDKTKRNQGWNEEEFFKVGEEIVTKFINTGKKHGFPKEHKRSLDFGCGTGRLLRFASRHFESIIGVDIAEGMIELSKKYNHDITNVSYHVNPNPDLRFIASDSIDLVYSFHVLQHIPERMVRIAFLKEFQRVLKKDGLLVFHTPVYIPFMNRIQIRRRLFRVLKLCGFSPALLMNKFNLYPIHMKSLDTNTIKNLFQHGFEMLETVDHLHKNGQKSVTFYFRKL